MSRRPGRRKRRRIEEQRRAVARARAQRIHQSGALPARTFEEIEWCEVEHLHDRWDRRREMP